MRLHGIYRNGSSLNRPCFFRNIQNILLSAAHEHIDAEIICAGEQAHRGFLTKCITRARAVRVFSRLRNPCQKNCRFLILLEIIWRVNECPCISLLDHILLLYGNCHFLHGIKHSLNMRFLIKINAETLRFLLEVLLLENNNPS